MANIWGRIEYPILIELDNEYFESFNLELFLVETNANEINAPIIAPKPKAPGLEIGESKDLFKTTPMLGKSVPIIEMNANWEALSWALASGRINCIAAKGKATARINRFRLFSAKVISTADNKRYEIVICLNHLVMEGLDSSSRTYDLLITIGRPSEKRIPKIAAKEVMKVISP
jgi:hypothetical protein